VGYGDDVPVTYLGRMLTVVLMTFGISIFAILTSFIASRVVGLRDEHEDIITTIKEENALIRAELAEVKELLQQAGLINADNEKGRDHG